MADNTTLDPGSGGDTIATDDVSGVKYQRVKLVNGTLDATDAIPGDASNGLDVDVTRSVLPTGAATAAKQPALGTAGTPSADVQTVQGVTSMTPLKVDPSGVTSPVSGPLTDTQLRATAVPVSGTVTANAGTGTLAVSAAALPLPSGASTAAKQPALGTAGTPSADVLSVQGAASMTALKVDGSAVTQPVSGTVVVSAVGGTVVVSGGVSLNVNPGSSAYSKKAYPAQTTTLRAVKASSGVIGGWFIYNPNASVAYVQIFDVASGSVTLGTTVPDVILPIPAGSAANAFTEIGIGYTTAITLACTTTAGGSTAPGTGLDLTIIYK